MSIQSSGTKKKKNTKTPKQVLSTVLLRVLKSTCPFECRRATGLPQPRWCGVPATSQGHAGELPAVEEGTGASVSPATEGSVKLSDLHLTDQQL